MIGFISTSLAATMFFQGLRLVGPSRAYILSTAELIDPSGHGRRQSIMED